MPEASRLITYSIRLIEYGNSKGLVILPIFRKGVIVEFLNSSNAITHTWGPDGLMSCSEAVDFMSYDENGYVVGFTGYGFCHHYHDEDGAPLVVIV